MNDGFEERKEILDGGVQMFHSSSITESKEGDKAMRLLGLIWTLSLLWLGYAYARYRYWKRRHPNEWT